MGAGNVESRSDTVGAAAATIVVFWAGLKLKLVLKANGSLCTVYVTVTGAALGVVMDRGAPEALTVTTVPGGRRVVVMIAPSVVVMRLVLVEVVVLPLPK